MKFLSSLILASALLTSGYAEEINYRPYISTRLAKVIMSDNDDIVVEEKCDGSGWIVHGDGHKTECPGCSACQNSMPKPDTRPAPVDYQTVKKARFLRRLFPLFKKQIK